MGQSILNSIKKVVGYHESDESFDEDFKLHINGILATLAQLGIGPRQGFMVMDSTATWEDFLGDDPRLNMVKTYMYLRVVLLFDTNKTSYVLEAMNKQALEFEWRLSVHREGESWVDPALL